MSCASTLMHLGHSMSMIFLPKTYPESNHNETPDKPRGTPYKITDLTLQKHQGEESQRPRNYFRLNKTEEV